LRAQVVFTVCGSVHIVCGVLLEQSAHRVSVLFSGMKRYYQQFPPQHNAEIFRRVQREYCYLGISFRTVFAEFEHWYRRECRPETRVCLLVADPEDSGLLEYQARFQLGYSKTDLTAEQSRQVSAKISSTSAAIRNTLQLIATLPDAGSHIEVRFHREHLRKWMYLIDGREVYVGLLQHGKDGLDGPVMVLGEGRQAWTLFQHFQEEWDSLWRDAEPLAARAGK